jgi:hypothetical protein
VPGLWRKENSFAKKGTPVKLTLYFTGQAKFTTKELKRDEFGFLRIHQSNIMQKKFICKGLTINLWLTY